MDGVGLQAQPQVGTRPPTSWKSKSETRSAAEAPGPGSFQTDATPAAPAPLVGRGPRPGLFPAPPSAPKGPPGPWPRRLPCQLSPRKSSRSFSSGRARQSGSKSFRNPLLPGWEQAPGGDLGLELSPRPWKSPKRLSWNFCASSSSLSLSSCARPATGPGAVPRAPFRPGSERLCRAKVTTRSCRVGAGRGVPVSRPLCKTICP